MRPTTELVSNSSPGAQEVRLCLKAPKIHDQWASAYLNPDLNQFYDRVFERIIQILAPKPNQTLLDGGCGYCFHAIRLARSGLQVTGVDFSDVALERAVSTIERAGMMDRIRVQRGDLLDLPFSDGAFDYVNCWGVLMHVPQIDIALEELIRVLKPAGKMVLMENNAASVHVQAKRLFYRARRMLRPPSKESTVTPWGCEEWEARESGRLLVRASDIRFLVNFCEQRGLRLIDRFAGQFTELYAKLPGRALKQTIYRFNEAWFEKIRRPEPAMGNVLVFEKLRAT